MKKNQFRMADETKLPPEAIGYAMDDEGAWWWFSRRCWHDPFGGWGNSRAKRGLISPNDAPTVPKGTDWRDTWVDRKAIPDQTTPTGDSAINLLATYTNEMREAGYMATDLQIKGTEYGSILLSATLRKDKA